MKNFMELVANIAEISVDLGMNTVCTGGFYQPEIPTELE
jgi:cyclic lactone autoinducer peptide